MCARAEAPAQRERQPALRPIPRPQLWARYANEALAVEAMDTQRFGIRSWSVEYRPEREPYPWCLIDNGEAHDG